MKLKHEVILLERKVEQLEGSLRATEVQRNILRRTVNQLRKEHAKERVRLKREIELLRNSA